MSVYIVVVASFRTDAVYVYARAIKANYTAKNFEIQFIFIRRVKLKRKTFGRLDDFVLLQQRQPNGMVRYTLCLCL